MAKFHHIPLTALRDLLMYIHNNVNVYIISFSHLLLRHLMSLV